MGYILCGHGGSGDHGQEDRIRGTCRLLPSRPELLTANIEEDWHYGLADVTDLTAGNSAGFDPEALYIASRPDAIPQGGRGLLWCWQGRPFAPRQAEKLRAVTVPNRHLLQTLLDQGMGNRLRLGPDPAFLVRRELRGGFRRDTIGLCFSQSSVFFEPRQGLLFESYCRLIGYLLTATEFDLALIPYCTGSRSHDGPLLETLYHRFSHSDRVHLRPDGSCAVLRGDISLCRMVIGAAGAVAAWSCGVPALCIGADPYALGTAAELFARWQDVLAPVGWLCDSGDLLRYARRFLGQEDTLRRQLEHNLCRHRHRGTQWDWERLRLLA